MKEKELVEENEEEEEAVSWFNIPSTVISAHSQSYVVKINAITE